MTTPTYADLVTQVAALSDRLAKPLSLDDLPLRDLRGALLENGEPLDLSILALAGQVADFGSAMPRIRYGTATLVWTAANGSAVLTVPHGLVDGQGAGVTPIAVLALQNAGGGPAPVDLQAQVFTATSFQLYGEFRNGGVATVSIPVGWLAVA